MEELIRSNLHLLQQASRLLADLPDCDFTKPDFALRSSTVGQHLRHCLDHYSSFLSGLPTSQIDYDHRVRCPELECSTDCAVAEVEKIQRGLEGALGRKSQEAVMVKMDCGGGEEEWHSSTLGRELQFLVSHTVHHFAMIGGMCHQLGARIEDDFGIAPSTLKHRALATID